MKDLKICFTSALYGDYKTLDKPAKFEKDSKYSYYLFTDIDVHTLQELCDWDVINTNHLAELSALSSPIKRSRYAKFLAWKILEQMDEHFDVIFYCDAWIYPKPSKNWQKLARQVLAEKRFPFMQTVHQTKSVRDGGVNGEIDNIVRGKRDTKVNMDTTRSFLTKLAPNVDMNFPQFFENTCFGYSPNHQSVKKITTEFWEIYSNESISFRDQPLWNFLLLKHEVSPIENNYLKENSIFGRFASLKRRFAWFARLHANRGTMRESYTSDLRNRN